MTAILARFDRWAAAGPFTTRGLALYRMFYAVCALILISPQLEWARAYPDSIYDPPFGPMRLFDGFPPYWVLQAAYLGVCIALVALLLGWHTRVASFTTTGLLFLILGFTYSVGKIDHSVLLVMLPSVLAFTGWGDALSVDALRRGAEPEADARQWPMRLLALLVGVGFFTAGWAKLMANWHDPATQAVQGTLFRQYHVHDRTDLLAGQFLELTIPVLWELVDIATLVLELGMLAAAVSWPTWRIALAVAASFHLGVHLMMNIPFSGNLVVYAAFLPWGALALPALGRAAAERLARWAPAAALGLGTAVWSLGDGVTGAREAFAHLLVYVGGAVGVAYLVRLPLRVPQVVRQRSQQRAA